MKKLLFFLFMVSAVAGILFCQKNPVNTEESPSSVPITGLALTDGALSGWDVDTVNMSDPVDTTGSGHYRLFHMKDSMALFNFIDGGATAYEHQVAGYSAFIVQHMKDSSITLEIYMVDYTNCSNAAAMYNFKKSQLMDPMTIGNYAQTAAIADTSHGYDIYAYAHFRQYYIELRFLGFDSQSISAQEAVRFLDHFKAIIN